MPQSNFRRSGIPPLQQITNEQLHYLLAREDARQDIKVTYPKLVDVLLAWMPEISDTQIAFHTNVVYQGFFGEGVDADERVFICMRANGYTDDEIAYAIE